MASSNASSFVRPSSSSSSSSRYGRLARSARSSAFLALAALAPFAAGCSDDDPVPGIADFGALQDLGGAPGPIVKAAEAVVRIGTNGLRGTGSFISADGLMMTNNHVLGTDVCAREGCFIELAFDYRRGEREPRVISAYAVPHLIDVGLDLAVLQVYALDDKGIKADKLATPSFLTFERVDAVSLPGSRIHVVGHPNGRLKKWSTGDVVTASGEWFDTTAFSLPGSSGSPVLDDEGHIVGLLHRGSASDGLVTPDGINNVSVCSASASVVDAIEKASAKSATDEQKGLTRLRSVNATVTTDDLIAYSEVFANARRTTVFYADGRGGDAGAPILDGLAEACDAGLARPQPHALEELSSNLAACDLAFTWIECRAEQLKEPGEAGSATSLMTTCPDDATREAFRARYALAFDQYRQWNGGLALSYPLTAAERLATSDEAGKTAATAALRKVLDENQPYIDLDLASYLVSYEVDTYQGVDVQSYVLSYTKVAHYELSPYSVVSGLLTLNRRGRIPSDAARKHIANLFADRRLGLSAHLYVEEVAYRSGIVF